VTITARVAETVSVLQHRGRPPCLATIKNSDCTIEMDRAREPNNKLQTPWLLLGRRGPRRVMNCWFPALRRMLGIESML
jgi:hypothetical protein